MGPPKFHEDAYSHWSEDQRAWIVECGRRLTALRDEMASKAFGSGEQDVSAVMERWATVLQAEFGRTLAAAYLAMPRDRSTQEVTHEVTLQICQGVREWLQSLPIDENGRRIYK